MKRAKKVKQALTRRIASWDDIVSNGFIGTNTKIAKEPNGLAYHRPGSQNTKKGRSSRKAHR